MMLKTKAAGNAVQEKQPGAPLFKAPGIAVKINEAETALDDLERRYKTAALDSVLAGNDNALAAIEGEIARARANVARFKTAHAGALEVDEKERRAILAEHNKTIIRVCRSHLAARDAAAEKVSVALAEAIAQFKIMVDRGAKAKAAVPEWGLQRGRKVEPDELYKLTQKEIARLYGPPPSIDGKCPFPGGDSLDISNRLQPQLLPPLADLLRQATTEIIENLTGKVAE